jgi:hypothetical protein
MENKSLSVDDVERRLSTLEKNNSESRHKTFWVACIAAAISFSSAIISFAQWKTTQELFYKAQRPYVSIHVQPIRFGSGEPIDVNMILGNAGKSPALRVGGDGRIFVGVNALQDAYQWFDRDAGKVFNSMQNEIISPNVRASDIEAIRSTISTGSSVGGDEFNFATAGLFRIVVAYRVAYMDQAGNRYWTDTCVGYGGQQSIVMCPEHNDSK